MEEIIRKAYYDPKTGLQSTEKLFQRLKGQGVTRAAITKFIKNQDIAQIHRKPTKRNYLPIEANGVDHIWQTDLCDVSNLGKYNKGYKWLLCIVDVYSRFAFVFPLKSKNKDEIVEPFRQLFAKRRTTTNHIRPRFGIHQHTLLRNSSKIVE